MIISISLMSYITLSVILFSIGMIGLVSRKNIFIIYMSIELMLNAINLMLVSLSRHYANMDGQIMAMMVIAIAAAEAAVFLSLIVTLFRNRRSLDIDDYRSLKQKDAL